MKTWEECDREDLNMIPKMIEAGWTLNFTTQDKKYNRTTPDNVPHDGIGFIKDIVHAWISYYNNHTWRVADLIDNHYCNFRNYDSLTEIIEKEK